MEDAYFKSLEHRVANGMSCKLGRQISDGYKPDVSVWCQDNILRFILESEHKTDRKAFLGDFLKAEMCAELEGASPELIIVMRPFATTTTMHIAKQLKLYAEWLMRHKGGSLSLSAIQVLDDDDYAESIRMNELLGSAALKSRGHLVYPYRP